MHAKTLLIPLLALMVILAPIARAASTDNTITFQIESASFKVPVNYVVYNKTVNIAANGSVTIDVTLPPKWTSSDVAAVIVQAKDVTSSIDLTAKDSSGATVATSTIVPLSTGYSVTLPASTSQIVLAASSAANATIIVYVQSNPVSFDLTVEKTSVTLKPGQTAWIHGTLVQKSGPGGWVWGTLSVTSPLAARAYWGTFNTGDIPPSTADIGNPIDTTGANWSKQFSIHIDATNVAPDQGGQYTISLKFYYDALFETPVNATNAQLVATLALTGTISNTTSSVSDWVSQHSDQLKWAIAGAGVVFGLLFLMALFGKKR